MHTALFYSHPEGTAISPMDIISEGVDAVASYIDVVDVGEVDNSKGSSPHPQSYTSFNNRQSN
jgi:hypothetical protein